MVAPAPVVRLTVPPEYIAPFKVIAPIVVSESDDVVLTEGEPVVAPIVIAPEISSMDMAPEL